MPAPAPDKPNPPQGEAVPPPPVSLQRKKSVSKAAQTDSESSIEEISVETKVSSWYNDSLGFVLG